MFDVLEVTVHGEGVPDLTIERDFTPAESAQRKADAEAFAKAEADAAAKAEANAIARNAAIAHAKSLGFTDQMIAVMYPNLAPAV